MLPTVELGVPTRCSMLPLGCNNRPSLFSTSILCLSISTLSTMPPLLIRMPKWERSRINWDWFFPGAHSPAVLPQWEHWRSQGILQPWCYLSCGDLFCFWRNRLGVWGISSLKQLDTTWQLPVTVHGICENPRVKWKQIEKASTVIISAGKVLYPGDMAWQTGSLGNTGGSTSARVIFLFTWFLPCCTASLPSSTMEICSCTCAPFVPTGNLENTHFWECALPDGFGWWINIPVCLCC